MPRRAANAPALDKARLLALLAEHPGATKRDLARLDGAQRLGPHRPQAPAARTRSRRRDRGKAKRGLTKAGELPEIAVLEITGIDEDGELLARPLNWESNAEPPTIYVMPPKDGAAPGGRRADSGAVGTARRKL